MKRKKILFRQIKDMDLDNTEGEMEEEEWLPQQEPVENI